MRRLALAACLASLPAMSPALSPLVDIAPLIQDRDWHLLAMDGVRIEASVGVSLRIEPDGSVIGKAPCNSYGAKLASPLPEFRLGPVRATRMACDRLTEEQAYFDALALMQMATMGGEQTLILTGPDGRSLEFVLDRDAATACKTCGD